MNDERPEADATAQYGLRTAHHPVRPPPTGPPALPPNCLLAHRPPAPPDLSGGRATVDDLFSRANPAADRGMQLELTRQRG
jgi:hypothetical protein